MNVFDSEQWSWRRAYKPYRMAGLNNVVGVYDKHSNCTEVFVVIPTAFVKYLRDVHGSNVEMEQVCLYAGNVGAKNVFGYMTADNSTFDLWQYGKLPSWLDPAIESVTR